MKSHRNVYLYFCAAVFYLSIIFLFLHPLAFCLNSCFLGNPCTDIFNEMWLDRAGIESFLQGHWSYSTNLEYPSGVNFFVHFLSWLHIYFSAPFVYLFPWPLSWNLTVVYSLLCGAMSAFWAVRRISGNSVAAFAAGSAMIIAPSTFYNICEGYLPQIWIAPLIIACYWLYEVIYSPQSYKQVCWLVVWTLISTLVYWINGLFLAICGCVMLFCRLPRLSAKVFAYLSVTAAASAVILCPFAYSLNKAQPMIADGLNRVISADERAEKTERAVKNSAELAGGNYSQRYLGNYCNSLKPAVPYIFATIFILLAAVEWKKHVSLVWLNCAALFFVLSLGPYLFADSSMLASTKVAMPYLVLVEAFQPLYRWSMPLRTLPLAFFFIAAGLAGLEQHIQPVFGKKRAAAAVFALIIASVFILGDLFYKESKRGYFLTPCSVPKFCGVMAQMPQSAFVDAPIGFIGNVYQLQIHHHKPLIACSGAYKGNYFNLVDSNSFLQYLFLWNNLAASNKIIMPFTFLRASISEDYVYGNKLKKEDAERTEVWQPQYSSAFSKEEISADYQKLLNQNIRYAVIHKASCFWIDNEHGEEVFKALCGIAVQHFGKPVYADDDVEIFEMKADINLPDDILEKARGCLK